jgi:hypothetical protein
MDTAIVGALAGLLGVWIGYWLQEKAASRRYLLDACAKVAALALEAGDHMLMAEVERSGGPGPDPLRPEFRSDSYFAAARVGIVSPTLSAAAEKLQTTVQNAIGAQGSPDPSIRAHGRQAAVDAGQLFRLTVRAETVTVPWWRDLLGRPSR